MLLAHTASFSAIGQISLIEDNNSGVTGAIVVNTLPGATRNFTIYFGYAAIFWKENYTSIYESNIKTYGMMALSNISKLIIGEDNIL